MKKSRAYPTSVVGRLSGKSCRPRRSGRLVPLLLHTSLQLLYERSPSVEKAGNGCGDETEKTCSVSCMIHAVSSQVPRVLGFAPSFNCRRLFPKPSCKAWIDTGCSISPASVVGDNQQYMHPSFGGSHKVELCTFLACHAVPPLDAAAKPGSHERSITSAAFLPCLQLRFDSMGRGS